MSVTSEVDYNLRKKWITIIRRTEKHFSIELYYIPIILKNARLNCHLGVFFIHTFISRLRIFTYM